MIGSSAILVLGSAGQVGSELLHTVWSPSVKVIGWDLAEIDISQEVDTIQAIKASRCDLVVNLAAYTAVDRAEDEPERAHAVNAQGAGNVALACAEAGMPLIHVSTDYVFNGCKQEAYVEEDPVDPLNVYGRSKAEGEERVRAVLPEHLIVRTSWIYGVHGANFLKTMLRLGAERDCLRVVADQLGSPTSASDLAQAILEMARQVLAGKPDGCGTFHYSGAGRTSWFEFAKEIFAIQGRFRPVTTRVEPITSGQYPTPAPRPANSWLDCSKIKRVFGIEARPWKTSLAKVIEQLLGYK